MEQENLPKEIAEYRQLLENYFEGTLTQDERHRLAVWLRADRRNRDLLMRLRDGAALKEYYARRSRISPSAEYKLLIKRMPQARRRRWYATPRYAAAIFLALIAAGFGIFMIDSQSPDLREPDFMAVDYMQPKATLLTPGGEVYEFDALPSDNGGNRLVYDDSIRRLINGEHYSDSQQPLYSLLEVPRGGEFKLVLPDGTLVWINSASSIRFPDVFAADKREVFVNGELYFEVKKDKARPFIVYAGEMKAEVLGTSFGISVYHDDPQWSTVLAEGRLRVSYRDHSVELEPNRKAMLANGSLSEANADIDKELAWLKHDFVFKSDRLEDITRRIEKWYPVAFRFADDDLRDYRFTATVSRDMNIKDILDLIGRMNVVTFAQKDGYIMVSPAK